MLSCQRPKGIIKRDEMAKIIEEMILADYWISLQPAEIRLQSDTSSFYGSIFRKYGYTLDDYLASVDYYLNDPERFARIIRKMGSSIEAHRDRLQAEIDAAEERAAEEQEAAEVPKDTFGTPHHLDTIQKVSARLPRQ